METYKKPVVASNPLAMSNVVTLYGAPSLLAKFLGVNDFHKEESLTTRKKLAE